MAHISIDGNFMAHIQKILSKDSKDAKLFFVKMAVLVYPAQWLPFQLNGSHSWHKCNYMAILWLVLRQFCQKETDTLVFFYSI